jgi:hypothetical protein
LSNDAANACATALGDGSGAGATTTGGGGGGGGVPGLAEAGRVDAAGAVAGFVAGAGTAGAVAVRGDAGCASGGAAVAEATTASPTTERDLRANRFIVRVFIVQNRPKVPPAPPARSGRASAPPTARFRATAGYKNVDGFERLLRL